MMKFLILLGLIQILSLTPFDDEETFRKDMLECFTNWEDLEEEGNDEKQKSVKQFNQKISNYVEAILEYSLSKDLKLKYKEKNKNDEKDDGKETDGKEEIESGEETDKGGKKKNDDESESAEKELSLSKFIVQTYRKVPYHNICHGLMVSFNSFKIAKDIKRSEESVKALTLAGLLHDIGHPGYGNKVCGIVTGENYKSETKKPLFCNLEKSDMGTCSLKNGLVFAKINNYFGLFESPEAVISAVDNVREIFYSSLEKFQQSKDAALKRQDFLNSWASIYCPSSELQHAIISLQILKRFRNYENKEQKIFIDEVVISIMMTHMHRAFQTDQSLTIFKEEKAYLEIVHVSDLVGMGEKDEALRGKMIETVNIEFKQEKQVFKDQTAIPNIYDNNPVSLAKNQKGFSGIVLKEIDKFLGLKGIGSSDFLEEVKKSIGKLQTDLANYIEIAEKTPKYLTDLFQKFSQENMKVTEDDDKAKLIWNIL